MTSYQRRKFIPLEQGWSQIQEAVDHLEKVLSMDEDSRPKRLFGPNEYERIYTICYNMCTQRDPYNWSRQLYQRHGETMKRYLQNEVMPALRNTTEQGGTVLLKELQHRWINHQIMNKWLKKFFTYLDRFYVKKQSLQTLSEVGLRCFRTIVYDEIKGESTAAILQLINDERDGRTIDVSLVQSILELYKEMGMGSRDAYNVDFEVPLLESTREFYARKREEWINDPTSDNVIKVKLAFTDERRRVAAYLNSNTEANLLHGLAPIALFFKEKIIFMGMDVINRRHERLDGGESDKGNDSWFIKSLIELHNECLGVVTNDFSEHSLFQRAVRDAFNEIFNSPVRRFTTVKVMLSSRCDRLLETGKLQEEASGYRSEALQRLFRLFQCVDNGVASMASIVQTHITTKGIDFINRRQARLDAGEKDKNDDPRFIKSLIELHEKYLGVVKNDFSGQSLFQRALNNSFVEIVNKSVGTFTIAELMSSFCDRILKSGGERLSETEVEESFDHLVQLFSYLADKDLFAEIYRNQLAKRLLSQRSTRDDAEKLMIAKLKVHCGTQFTSKMEGMLNDLAVGSRQRQEFNERMRNFHTKLEFNAQILTTGLWPTYKSPEVMLTPEMNNCTKVFKEWHEEKYPGRKLAWVLTQGSATVRGTYGEKSYDFTVTTLQALALEALNGGDTLSLEDLGHRLSLEDGILKPLMHSLSCGKYRVINKTPAGNKIEAGDMFAANPKFTCNQRKIRIPMASLDSSFNTEKVEEDRSVAIDAAIVRTMKARKTISHQQLLAEVLAQLSFFNPNAKVIKRRVEGLIEREYMERSADSADLYNYIA